MHPDAPLDVQDIKDAVGRIAPHLVGTPCFPCWELESGESAGPVWLKAENLQRTGSFKARGALNWLLTAPAHEHEPGLITVSAGNHAIALAWAARQRQTSLIVVMPAGSSPLKIEATERLGAKVIVEGDINAAVARTHELAQSSGRTLVHPYNDLRVMAGQGTVGLELLRQLPDLTRILCPIGGGGLISGLGVAVKAVKRDVDLIGVEPIGAATMLNAWSKQDWRARLSSVDTLASSLAPAVVGEHTYAVSRRVVDDIVTVDEEAIACATRRLALSAHLYAEPGAAVALAGLDACGAAAKSQGQTVLIITGGNMEPALARRLLG